MMKTAIRSMIPAILACLLAGSSVAQKKAFKTASPAKAGSSYYSGEKDWYRQKKDRLIGIDRTLTTVDGKTIDLRHPARPVFVNFGFYGCHPCEQELPVYIEAATLFADVDFVYITFDEEPVRQREFREVVKPDQLPGTNYYIVHMDRAEINRRDLALGYPTKYFIGTDGLVKMVTSGGNASEAASVVLGRIRKIIGGEYDAD